MTESRPGIEERDWRRLADEVLYRAECHVTAERFDANVHFFVGMVAAGLAAAAGGTAFAGYTLVAGSAGVAAAALTGFLTVYKPDERAQSHARAAREHKHLYDRIDLRFRLGWQDGTQPQAPLEAYAQLRHEAAQLDRTAIAVSRRLCTKAESFRSARDEWYPPSDETFDAWRRRRWTVHSGWFARLVGAPGKPAPDERPDAPAETAS